MSIRTIRRSAAALAVVLGAVASSVPVPAGARPHQEWASVLDDDGLATAPCSGTGTFDGSRLSVVLAAHAVEPSAVVIRVYCAIIQGGIVVARVTASGASVAANATVTQIPAAPYTLCADVYMLYADGSESRTDPRCPGA